MESIKNVVAATLKLDRETQENAQQISKIQDERAQQKSKAQDERAQQISKTQQENVQQQSKTFDRNLEDLDGIQDKKQDHAGPTEQEISQALDRTLEELLTPEDLARIEDKTLKEKEEIRESLALVKWCLEIQKTYGGSLKTASKKAGTSEASYRRKLKKLEKFGF